jgi:hypothetical protein
VGTTVAWPTCSWRGAGVRQSRVAQLTLRIIFCSVFHDGAVACRLDDGGRGRLPGDRRIDETGRDGVEYWMEGAAPRLRGEYCLALCCAVSSKTWKAWESDGR